jgi:hypothetical protein
MKKLPRFIFLLLPLLAGNVGAISRESVSIFERSELESDPGTMNGQFFEAAKRMNIMPSAFHGDIEVSLRMDREKRLTTFENLSWSSGRENQKTKGWRTSGNSFLWIPGDAKTEANIDLRNNPDQELDLSHFEQLVIQFKDLGDEDAVDFSVAVKGVIHELKLGNVHDQKVFGYSDNYELKALRTLKFRNVDWISAGNLRNDGAKVPNDGIWRFQKADDEIILQRSFSEDLEGVTAVDLTFRSDARLVSIELYLKDKGFLPAGSWFKFTDEYSVFHRTPGQYVVRIPKKLLQRMPGYDRPQVLGAVKVVLQSKSPASVEGSIMSLDLDGLSARGEAGAKEFLLPAQWFKAGNRTRWCVLNLSDLARVNSHFLFKGGSLRLLPRDPALDAGIEIERIGFVHREYVSIPKTLLVGPRLLEEWGGPFLMPSQIWSRNELEMPLVDAFLPFDGRRIQYSSNGETPRVTTDDQGTLFEGEGTEFKIDWPVDFKKSPNTEFIMQASTEGSSFVRSVFSLNGAAHEIQFFPNQPVAWPAGEGRINRVGVRLFFKGPSFRVKIRRLVVFHSKLINLSEAWNQRRPNGSELTSPREEFSNWFKGCLGNSPMGMDFRQGIEYSRFKNGDAWFPMPFELIKSLMTNSIQPQQNAYFSLDSIVFHPVQEFSNQVWSTLNGHRFSPSEPEASKEDRGAAYVVSALYGYRFSLFPFVLSLVLLALSYVAHAVRRLTRRHRQAVIGALIVICLANLAWQFSRRHIDGFEKLFAVAWPPLILLYASRPLFVRHEFFRHVAEGTFLLLWIVLCVVSFRNKCLILTQFSATVSIAQMTYSSRFLFEKRFARFHDVMFTNRSNSYFAWGLASLVIGAWSLASLSKGYLSTHGFDVAFYFLFGGFIVGVWDLLRENKS